MESSTKLMHIAVCEIQGNMAENLDYMQQAGELTPELATIIGGITNALTTAEAQLSALLQSEGQPQA